MKTIKVSIAEALKACRKDRPFEKGIWIKTKAPKESIFEAATKPAKPFRHLQSQKTKKTKLISVAGVQAAPSIEARV